MGTKSDHALLPPESARAIYMAIESASELNAKRIEEQNRRLESQDRVLGKIADGIEQLKDKLNDGAVRFEHHSGEIKRLDGEMRRLATDVSDVESAVTRLAQVKGTPPVAFPARKPESTALMPKRRRDEEEPAIVVVRWKKVVNAVVITVVTILTTLGVTWVINHASPPVPEKTNEAGMKPSKVKIEPPDLPVEP